MASAPHAEDMGPVYPGTCLGLTDAERRLREREGRRGFYDVALFDFMIRSHDYCTDIIFFQIQSHSIYIVRKFQKLSRHTAFKSVNSCNTVTDLNYRTEIENFQMGSARLHAPSSQSGSQTRRSAAG